MAGVSEGDCRDMQSDCRNALYGRIEDTRTGLEEKIESKVPRWVAGAIAGGLLGIIAIAVTVFIAMLPNTSAEVKDLRSGFQSVCERVRGTEIKQEAMAQQIDDLRAEQRRGFEKLDAKMDALMERMKGK